MICKINRLLHLSSYLWGIPLRCDMFRKIIDQKNFPFIATNNWIVLAVQWSVKYLCAPNFPLIQKSGGEKKKNRGNYKAFSFWRKRKETCISLCLGTFIYLFLEMIMKLVTTQFSFFFYIEQFNPCHKTQWKRNFQLFNRNIYIPFI